MKRRWAWCVGLLLLGLGFGWFLYGRTRDASYREPITGRSYRVIIQARHDVTRSAPVLFVLHAYATPPDVVVRGHFLELLAVLQRDYVLVVPEGRKNAQGHYFWNATRACCAADASPDDVEYLHGVLADLKTHVALDAARVWALGVSNGGFMAYRWACSGHADLTGLVSISGAGPSQEDPACTPARALDVLQVHGDLDDVVRYGGGEMNQHEHPSALNSLQPFLTRARITHAPRVSQQRTLSFETLHKREWSQAGQHFGLWTVEGGGHQLRAAQLAMPSILAFLAHE